MSGVGERSIRQREPGVHRKLPGAGCGWNIKCVVLWGVIKQRLTEVCNTHIDK